MASDPQDETGNAEATADATADAAADDGFTAAPSADGNETFRAGPRDQATLTRGGSIQDAHLDVILDVPVTLSMEVGRSRIAIRDLLQLNPGSVVKLQRAVGDPMDILVNGCLVAKGEVVVVGDQFGIRIADVVSPEERVKTLR